MEQDVVLVTGTRHVLTEKHKVLIYTELKSLGTGMHLVHGGCSGVDEYAGQVASELGWKITVVKADWSKGKRAGPERNQKMIDTFRPHIVLAFPTLDSKGTRDCIARARAYSLRGSSRLKVLKEILLV